MIELASYLYRTITQEFYDQVVILKQITQYYSEQIQQKLIFNKKIAGIDRKLKKASNYHEWYNIAQQHDELPQIQEKVNKVYSPYYDYSYIHELVQQLAQSRSNDSIDKLIKILRSHSYRNIGNITSQLLYKDAYNTTYKLIEDFQQEVVLCIRKILESDIPYAKKIEFFGEIRHALGRSALLLSGGAILGMYHIGVVQTLIEADCIPNIIAGSSAGSMIASFLATRPRDQFFLKENMTFTAFINDKKVSLWKKAKRAVKEGQLMDIRTLQTFLKDNLGDITFQEAFDQFGWILNITVTGSGVHDEDRLLNYLTAPNVLIWSACAASCAIPFVFGATHLFEKDVDGQLKPYTLMNRKFMDGSIAHDLPTNKLSVLFNVNNFIVSQTNPWVIPFKDYTEQLRTTSNPVIIRFLIIIQQIKQFILAELKHRANQISLVFPSAITKFFNIFTQSYVGNITIWPVSDFSKYLKIMDFPTSYESLLCFINDARQRTYPKVRQIKSSMFFEKEINKCFKIIKKQSRLNIKDMKEISEEGYEDKIDDLFQQEQIDQIKEQTKRKNKKNIERNESFMIPRMKSFK